MTLLILGVLLWILTHSFPVMMYPQRNKLIASIGENPYKGIFSLLILGAIALIIIGWRSIIPEFLYVLPAWSRHLGMLMVVIGFIFMAVSKKSRITYMVRHPQLMGVAFWALAHLMMNGENRSIVLFGGLAFWSILSIIMINRRDGAKPEAPEFASIGSEVGMVIGGVVVAGVVLYFHEYVSGIPLIGGAG